MSKDTLAQAAELIKSGDKAGARQLLVALVKREPDNEYAWLALSYTVESREHVIRCLHTVQTINPNNAHARRRLSQFVTPPFVLEDIPEAAPSEPVPAEFTPKPTTDPVRPAWAAAAQPAVAPVSRAVRPPVTAAKPKPALVEPVETLRRANDIWLYVGSGTITLVVAALSALMWLS